MKSLTANIKVILVVTSLLLAGPSVAQQLNMTSILQNNEASYTNTPFDIGSIYSVFDGSFSSLARCRPTYNPMVISITFNDSYDLTRSRLMSATPATWTMEVAANTSDMNSKTGSYRRVIYNASLSQNVYRDLSFTGANDVKVVRVTMRRTTSDYYPHMREWELYGTRNETVPVPEYISIEPDNAYLNKGSARQFQAFAFDSNAEKTQLSAGVVWSSNNSGVASVSASGMVTAVNTGTAMIKAIYTLPTGGTKTTTTNVTVLPVGAVCK